MNQRQVEPQEEVKPKRRRKKSGGGMHNEEGEGWAVSYSDMLMVLMSFFIIFFSQEEDKGAGKGTIGELVYKLNLGGIAVAADTFSEKEKEAMQKGPEKMFPNMKGEKRAPASVSATDVLKNFKVSKIDAQVKVDEEGKWNQMLKKGKNASKYKEGLIIDFTDNIYPNGKYTLNKRALKELKVLLKHIEPFKEQLNIVFIGHTDSVPVISEKGVIDSNLILSHLRAAKAVEYAIDNGFDPMWVSSQGLSEFTRNSRSLSMRVMER